MVLLKFTKRQKDLLGLILYPKDKEVEIFYPLDIH